MIALLALTAADFDALDQSVARCAKDEVRPVFTNEAARRSAFLTEAYREQEAIVDARRDLANRRRALREGSSVSADSSAGLAMEAAAIEDRQQALNDRRLLESLRSDALDAKRRYYLAHCANGKD